MPTCALGEASPKRIDAKILRKACLSGKIEALPLGFESRSHSVAVCQAWRDDWTSRLSTRSMDLADFSQTPKRKDNPPAPCAARKRGDEHLKLCQRELKALGGQKHEHNLSKEFLVNDRLHAKNVSFVVDYVICRTLLHSIRLKIP